MAASSSTSSSTRLFRIGTMSFRIPRRARDALFDCLSTVFETVAYLLGPILICFAIVIIAGLAHTFFSIMVPMLSHHHLQNPHRNMILGAHIAYVVFILINIVFNYAACVLTTNHGPKYDRVMRELADKTDFSYPETPEEVEQFRRDYEDRMMIRIRRRQQAMSNDSNGGVTQRRTGSSSQAAASPAPVRRWMLMGPHEWGYCLNTKQPKAPRSHYDHVTKKLVPCLDHYCPWMFNAIGYFNYRYFFNFLVFVCLGMLYGAVLTFRPFRNISTPLYREHLRLFRKTGKAMRVNGMVPLKGERMAITLSFMLCISVGIAVLGLAGFHTYLILTSQTTIEFHANFANRRRAKLRGGKWKNPYSLGYKRNWQQVFGTGNVLWSMLPSLREPEFLPVPMADGKRHPKPLGLTSKPTGGVDIV